MARTHRYRTNPTTHINIWPDRAHLQDVDGDITSQEKHVLDTQRASHIIERYYCQRWNVTMEYLSTLHWEVYTKVY